MPAPPITDIDHIGIRVSDRDIAKTFYEALGFTETAYFRDGQANEMVNASGLRINLILNGAKQPQRHNILLDAPVKYCGYTHAAFVVPSLSTLQQWLAQHGIAITEGPVRYGQRRITLFIRDPDGNVLEFNELLNPTDQENPHETV